MCMSKNQIPVGNAWNVLFLIAPLPIAFDRRLSQIPVCNSDKELHLSQETARK